MSTTRVSDLFTPPKPTPTFESALTAAARNLGAAEENHLVPEVAEASARIADRWLTLAALLKP